MVWSTIIDHIFTMKLFGPLWHSLDMPLPLTHYSNQPIIKLIIKKVSPQAWKQVRGLVSYKTF